ncbi:alpha-1,2 glucosyltransferas-like protein alg10 [Bimuria novae-zelandiae CBS 107.79]|uniref:Dol-P-Glc:Glc(2)Man(9)GlcNAc(2)-PP-Dol alpha-1,2-glucosyltransferase n=1 Tax=Bimuria novae-zelandiae CBS 107.79 TaxID=1447943 RepID=A0A6A5UV89_9PLEO|nr:alpha-1,2 glucosyltransferas-like protein alg10 [Bimuria novae-zelandiae CBS 107.79]
MGLLMQAWALPAAFIAVANLSTTWFMLVSEEVPEPYLDEFFHVPQAQRYCQNDYTWNPKITTPPGLYLASLLFKPLAGCDTSSLRALNVGALCLICVLSYQIRRTLRAPPAKFQKPNKQPSRPESKDDEAQLSFLDAHTALNICLFPPLFFFSGLYYTDVMSTLVVLAAYSTYLSQRGSTNYFLSSFLTINSGVIALLFRQTNVFWVAVFPAGLAVVETLKRYDEIYDTSVAEAGPRHYFAFLLYLPRDVLMNRPIAVIKAVLPYLALLALFGGFVLWNGGVVLGDKSAHVATIHLPQMLYLWPYTAFFSLPTMLPALLQPILPTIPTRLRSLLESNLTGTSQHTTPSLLAGVLFTAFALVAAHFNTLIHPYTLADNRHYVFYIFRYLRRDPALKYVAAPIYYICAYLTVRTLAAPATSPIAPRIPKKQARLTDPTQSTQISWVIIWTATTALSVITTPLVEPRYFIIPWVMWRLHVPEVRLGGGKYDRRLMLETVWLGAVNVWAGYMFLARGFEWGSEKGRVQRFLW